MCGHNVIVSVKNRKYFQIQLQLWKMHSNSTKFTTGTLLNFIDFMKITLDTGLQHVKITAVSTRAVVQVY